jgi:hypothetical protein
MHSKYKRNKGVVMMVVLREVDIREVLEADMDVVTTKDMEEGEEDPPLSLIMDKLSMCQYFVPNHMLFVGIIIVLIKSQNIV